MTRRMRGALKQGRPRRPPPRVAGAGVRKAKPAPATPRENWDRLREVFGNRCAYCRRETDLTRDHIVPRSAGGPNVVANYLPVCQPCNVRRGCMPPLEWLSRWERTRDLCSLTRERVERAVRMFGGAA